LPLWGKFANLYHCQWHRWKITGSISHCLHIKVYLNENNLFIC
jgi:hypothetical protein